MPFVQTSNTVRQAMQRVDTLVEDLPGPRLTLAAKAQPREDSELVLLLDGGKQCYPRVLQAIARAKH